MAKSDIEIVYSFRCDDGSEREFTVILDPITLNHRRQPLDNPPAWTHLEAAKCEACPLNSADHQHCPVALSLVDLLQVFDGLVSFAEVEVIVTTPQRVVSRRTSAQKALSSLVGLYMATSGCPAMDFLKPMARFHLPFASREETIFRVVSSYLTAQYYRHQQGDEADWDLVALREAYSRLHWVNIGIATRLRNLFQGDANVNAIVLLDLFAQEMPMAIDQQLKELRYLYQPFLEAGAAPATIAK